MAHLLKLRPLCLLQSLSLLIQRHLLALSLHLKSLLKRRASRPLLPIKQQRRQALEAETQARVRALQQASLARRTELEQTSCWPARAATTTAANPRQSTFSPRTTSPSLHTRSWASARNPQQSERIKWRNSLLPSSPPQQLKSHSPPHNPLIRL